MRVNPVAHIVDVGSDRAGTVRAMKTPTRILAGLATFVAATLASAQGMTTWPWFNVPGSQSSQAEEVLAKLVIVSRHGVRTPIAPASQLAQLGGSTLARTGSGPGLADAARRQLARIMGTYYRRYASEGQAMTAAGCPARRSTCTPTSPQRTKASAKALLDGFAAELRVQLSDRGPTAKMDSAVPSLAGRRVQARSDDRRRRACWSARRAT